MTLQVNPLEYSPIQYNEAIEYLERTWNRPLSDHEKNVLIQGYKIGRTIEMLDQWTKEGIKEQLEKPSNTSTTRRDHQAY